MRIRCVKEFRDLKTVGKPMRRVGEVWEADASRLREINASGYGAMVEEAPAEQPEKAPAARKKTTPKKGTASRSRARKSAQEG